jgi:hypothetical protein
MDGLRMPAGYNRSPRRYPPRDRGLNDSDRLLVRVGEDLGPTEASGLTRNRLSQT